MNRIKYLFLYLASPFMFLFGFVTFLLSGKTSEYSYQAMIRLFCLTKGYFVDIVSFFVAGLTRNARFENSDGVLGNMSGANLQHTLGTLKDKGYIVFESALSEEQIAKFLAFSDTTKASTRVMDNQSKDTYIKSEMVFDPKSLKAVRYDYSTQDLLNHEAVQLLMSDPSILNLAQSYLGCRPILDIVTMWWHTNFSKVADKEAAQYFHFDMDRIKWIKFFVYLTDVGPENGPHTFVSTSHRSGQIPRNLLRKGYTRLTDEEVKDYYSADKFIEFCAPKGTIIVEDTRGLHKGKHVTGDPRLLFQLQFTQNLFGTVLPVGKLTLIKEPKLEKQLAINPDIYSAFTK